MEKTIDNAWRRAAARAHDELIAARLEIADQVRDRRIYQLLALGGWSAFLFVLLLGAI